MGLYKPMDDGDRLLNPEELAAYLNVPKGTVFSLTCRGQIPVTRLGPRTPRYRVSDIDAWLESKTKRNP